MKTKFRSIFILPALLAGLHPAAAQGTAFTYQGQLNAGGAPAVGSYDFIFALYDHSQNGNQIGPSVTNSAVGVANGLFTTALDFGGGVFNGSNYWLDLSVRSNNTGPFTELVPRQPVTPAPYAIFANTASNLSGTFPAAQLSGAVGNTQLANNSITITPGAGLSGGGTAALGGSTTLNNTGVLSVTGNADITASTVGGAVTLGDTATDANTASTIVKRDGTGSFSATTLTLGANLNLPATTSTTGIIYSGGHTLMYSAFGADNFFAGLGAGNLTMSGRNNTANGNYALAYNTTGNNNTAIGESALIQNTTGGQNTAIGENALFWNTTGSGNTAIGQDALFTNYTGADNTAIGWSALNNNTTGFWNTATGVSALLVNTTGYQNTANGVNALFNNTTGFWNTANGVAALFQNTTGNNNTANGVSALYNNTNGSDNTANGVIALFNNTSGSNNIALGYQGGYNLTTGNSNIDIGNMGVAGDDSIIRIGTSQTATYLTGTVYANGVALTSDRDAKENFAALDSQAVLARVAALPLTEWNYKNEAAGIRHVGPMAQDFQAAFQLNGGDDKHISVVDESGVALAAIQGLNEKLEQQGKEKDAEIQALKQSVAELKNLVQSLAEKK